ncbi:ABC transporter ATP-binding protein [Pontibacter ruber]|uniref:ABC transporter ATP-binding protein n=1 Tax=Pontibacter ruber TaxID=1343895 RepID=A0ABW5CVQ2_9BACT|nr:ABC transporter ATP-binding protein [Pontibacter ruber]
MKKTKRGNWTKGLCLLLLLLPLSFAQAQDQQEEREEEKEMHNIDTEHDKILKLHPLQIGEIYLSYEKLRTPRISNEFGISYVYTSYLKSSDWFPEDKSTIGIGVRMSQRHYTSKKKNAPFGFFHGPMLGYRFLAFEKNVFGLEELPPNDPNYKYVGRLYVNALDLSYQAGGQFPLGKQFTFEVAASLGVRAKVAKADGAGDMLEDKIIGRIVHSDENTAAAIVPLPQLKLSLGYAF